MRLFSHDVDLLFVLKIKKQADTRHIDTSTIQLELRKSQVFTARYSLCIDDIHVNSATIKTNRIKLNRQDKGFSSLTGLPRRRLLGRNMKHLLSTSVIDNPKAKAIRSRASGFRAPVFFPGRTRDGDTLRSFLFPRYTRIVTNFQTPFCSYHESLIREQ